MVYKMSIIVLLFLDMTKAMGFWIQTIAANKIEFSFITVPKRNQFLLSILPPWKYEILSPHGLPTHFDKLILYYILLKLWKKTQFESLEHYAL